MPSPIGLNALRNAPLLLGHRGARRASRENTYAAFDLALEHGCDGFELDVHQTSDLQCVVCHDARYGPFRVAQSRLDALRGRGEFPCLPDVVARYASRAFLDIELKVAGMESAVAALLQGTPFPRGVLVSSFLPEVLRAMRAQAPEIPLGLIIDGARRFADWRELGVDVLVAARSLVDVRLVDEVHQSGRRIFAWTINSQRAMRRIRDLGVDAIISDDTAELCRALRSA